MVAVADEVNRKSVVKKKTVKMCLLPLTVEIYDFQLSKETPVARPL